MNRSIERFPTSEGLVSARATNERMERRKERKRRTIDSLESRNSFVATADPVSVTSAGTIGLFYT